MSVYLDANVIIALFVPDALSGRATALVTALSTPIVISDMAALEFASTVAKMGRTRELSQKTIRDAFLNFDGWAVNQQRIEIRPADIAQADAYVRRLDINLHGADAIHVAIAARTRATLLTLDSKMRANARKVGVAVV